MNNLIHLNGLDPIFNEYEAFADKGAGLKTIAFKYFGADISQASEYLKVSNRSNDVENKDLSFISIMHAERYYQPELI